MSWRAETTACLQRRILTRQPELACRLPNARAIHLNASSHACIHFHLEHPPGVPQNRYCCRTARNGERGFRIWRLHLSGPAGQAAVRSGPATPREHLSVQFHARSRTCRVPRKPGNSSAKPAFSASIVLLGRPVPRRTCESNCRKPTTNRRGCPLRDMVENSSALVDLLSLGVCHEYLCRVQSGEIRL